MRPYATGCQRGAARAGSFFAPRSRLGVSLRNAVCAALTAGPTRGLFERLVKHAATDFAPPEYAG